MAVFVAGCGGIADPAASVPTVPSVTPMLTGVAMPGETMPPTSTAAQGTGTTPTAAGSVALYPNHGRADDYTWVAGQLSRQRSCWIVTYVSPLSKSRPDQYNNHFTLLPGSRWNAASVKDGEWVVVTGQAEPGTAPAPGCSAHGYRVTELQSNPDATTGGTPGVPGVYPAYGHAPDYIWIAGQLKQQGSCWIVTYVSPLVDTAADQYNNQLALQPGGGWQSSGLKDGAWVVVQGQPEPGIAAAAGCSAHGYIVSTLQPNPNAAGAEQSAGTPTPVQSAAATGTPDTGNGGSNLAIQVTQFSVSSNFEIRGQFNATNNGKMNIQDLVTTHIQVMDRAGEVLFKASAPSIQGGVMDAKPVAGLEPGITRPYGFSASPGTISKHVVEGEVVTGVLTLSADGRTVNASLPATKVTPIRIP